MKNNWSALLLQSITKGTLRGPKDWVASSLSHDSRSLVPGQLYVAIRGQEVDGHDYVSHALSRGAVGVLVDHVAHHLPKDAPLLVVHNVEEALTKIGSYVRRHIKGIVIGVTGSSGKTSTKDMLGLCLSKQGKVHASLRSFNSRWGVPLTLSECRGDEDYVVLEMGMSAPGELSHLTRMVRPDVAIVTTIGHAHMEQLGSLDNIARAKSEIFEGVPDGGTALIPEGLSETHILFEKAKAEKIKNIFFFGKAQHCALRLISYEIKGAKAHISASIHEKVCSYTLNVLGRHFAMNSLAVLGAVAAAKADVKQAARDLADFSGSHGRGTVVRLQNGVLLFDESYNANPGSMRAALEAFASYPVEGRRYVVLGDMLSLGKDSDRYHAELSPHVLDVKPHAVFTCGKGMEHLHRTLDSHVTARHHQDVSLLIEDVVRNIKAGDVVMIKASNAMGFHRVSTALSKKFS